MYLPLQITPLRFQEITVLYVLLRLMASDYHFGIFKHFLNLHRHYQSVWSFICVLVVLVEFLMFNI